MEEDTGRASLAAANYSTDQPTLRGSTMTPEADALL